MAFDDADEPEPEPDHETILEALIRSLLTSDDLEQLCSDAGIAVLIDGDGDPVFVRSAETYADAAVLTLDRGVYLELSDGGCFGLTMTVSARGRHDTTALPPPTDKKEHVPRPTPGARPEPDQTARSNLRHSACATRPPGNGAPTAITCETPVPQAVHHEEARPVKPGQATVIRWEKPPPRQPGSARRGPRSRYTTLAEQLRATPASGPSSRKAPCTADRPWPPRYAWAASSASRPAATSTPTPTAPTGSPPSTPATSAARRTRPRELPVRPAHRAWSTPATRPPTCVPAIPARGLRRPAAADGRLSWDSGFPLYTAGGFQTGPSSTRVGRVVAAAVIAPRVEAGPPRLRGTR